MIDSFLNIIKTKKIIFFLSAVVASIFIYQGWYLRGLGYERIPNTDIADEYDYVWQALSLQKYGIPVGWSLFDGVYGNPKFNAQKGNLDGLGIRVDGKLVDLEAFKINPKPVVAISKLDWGKGIEYMTFVEPFFDHSPLGGFIFSLGLPKNINSFENVKPVDFRKPSLILAIITSIFLFILVLQITSQPSFAALSVAIYSTVPTYILATRGAFLENASVPFTLAGLIFLLLGVDLTKNRPKKTWLLIVIFLSGFLGGISVLIKETSIGFVFGVLIIILLIKSPKRYFFTYFLGAVIPVLVYAIWGMWLQKDLFLAVIMANSVRVDFGALKLLTNIKSLEFKNFPLDGWWIWGVISFLILGLDTNVKKNKSLFLTIPLFLNILVIVLTSNSNYPWYYLSAIPFFAAMSSIVIGNLFKKPNLSILAVFILIPVSSSIYWGYSVLHQSSLQNLNIYRTFVVSVAIAYLIQNFLSKFKYAKIIWKITMFLIVAASLYLNYRSIQFIVVHWGNTPQL